jgi:DNA (cytosine-5)-methyltransferase 1
MKTHLDLFSGIGGFALAARWNNIETIGFVENENYPRRILGKQFPGIPIHSDIHDFDATPFRGVSLITGGFPCQPFSVSGKQRGKEDDRFLWKEMLRVIVEAQPTWVLAENVAGIINMALDEVLLDLEAEDYATATVILPACSQNALHRRDRVWIIAKSLAHSKCQSVRDKGSGQDASETSSSKGELRERQRIWSDSGECSKDVAHSDSERRRLRHTVRQDAEDAWESPRSTQHGTGKFIGRLGGSLDGIPEGLDFPRRWGDGSWENGIPRVTTKKENRAARLKALGNSILPQVAFQIIKAMKKASNNQHTIF